jgi:hypothetical protein
MGSQPRVPRLPASWRLTIRLNCGEAEAPVPGQVLLASVGFLAALRRQAALISEAARVTRAGLLTYGWAMAEVDPDDDRIHRFIVRHFRYDTERHERRHVFVAAFDNEREMWARMEEIAAEIRRHREAGEDVDRGEHASGATHEPGYLRKAAHGHVVSRAISHGVFPLRLQEGELPSDMAVSRPESPRRNDDQQAG